VLHCEGNLLLIPDKILIYIFLYVESYAWYKVLFLIILMATKERIQTWAIFEQQQHLLHLTYAVNSINMKLTSILFNAAYSLCEACNMPSTIVA